MHTSVPAPAPASRSASQAAQDVLFTLERYAAKFDGIVGAWKTQLDYGAIADDLGNLLQLLKEAFPEASVVASDLVTSHDATLSVLLNLQRAQKSSESAQFSERDLLERQKMHGLAVETVRAFVLRKTH